MISNQQKITSIINQLQKNGWMEGWDFKRIEFEFGPIEERYYFDRPDRGYRLLLSLSDIIFDKDFPDDFFPFKIDKFCDGCIAIKSSLRARMHKSMLLSMDTQQRIDFLYKHVEEKEEDFSCPSSTIITCGRHKKYVHFSTLDAYNEHVQKHHPKPKCEPIEQLNTNFAQWDFITTDRDVLVKTINLLIKHHNERCHDKE